MSNIHILRNVVIDRAKVADLVKDTPNSELRELLGVKNSQASNVKRGAKLPSHDGLLRLMMHFGVKPEDIAGVKVR